MDTKSTGNQTFFLITQRKVTKSNHFVGQKAGFNTFQGIGITLPTFSNCFVSSFKDKNYPLSSALLIQTGGFSVKTKAPIILSPTARNTDCHFCKGNAFINKNSIFTYFKDNLPMAVFHTVILFSQFLNITYAFYCFIYYSLNLQTQNILYLTFMLVSDDLQVEGC